MKKFVSGLIAVLMMAGALVAFSGSAANAACPYGGCVRTDVHIKAPHHIKVGHRAKICVFVTAEDGNGRPKGHVTLHVVRQDGTHRFVVTRHYGGSAECFVTPREPRGRYTITAKYNHRVDSRWKDSDNAARMNVVRHF